MKKYRIWTLIGVVTLLIMSVLACEQSDVNRTFEGPYFVRFTDTTLTYKESYSKPISIQVHNAGPILQQPVTINYTISGTAREGKEYSIVGTKGTVIIPTNASTGNIVVKLINNANNILESTSLTFTLTSVQPSTLQVGFGKDNIIGKSITLTIQDDCLLGGTYTGTAKYNSGTASVSDIAVTSSDCKQYVLSNWNLGLLNYDAEKAALTFVDNGDNSLTIPSQGNNYLGTTGALSGTGAWNPRTRQITLNLNLKIPYTTAQNTTRDTTLLFVQTYTPQ